MKKIGIVGGAAWPSTVEYYTEFCRRSEKRYIANNLPGVPATPEMSIESLDLNKAIFYIGRDGDEPSWARFDEYHNAALKRLEASGADFALMASNTPHHRFKEIVQGVGIPVLSIFEVAAKECSRINAKNVLILGTALTMRSSRIIETFAKCGVEAASPSDDKARESIIQLIAELQLGKIEGTAERLGMIAKGSFEQRFSVSQRPLVCLACTELPLGFPELKTLATFEFDGVLYVNTTAAHINAAFEFAASA